MGVLSESYTYGGEGVGHHVPVNAPARPLALCAPARPATAKAQRGVCRADRCRYTYITLRLYVWFLVFTVGGGLVCFVTVGGGCLFSRVYNYSVWLVDWLVGLFPPLFETHVCLFLGAGLFFGWTTCCLVRWCADPPSRWMGVYPPFGVSSLGQVQLLVGLVNPGGSVPVLGCWVVGLL